MSYPGDHSLSPDVRQRILATFEQTLDLAEQGNRQEALLGCDFVLRMDPSFAPARRLAERLEASNGAAPAVDDLRAALAAGTAGTAGTPASAAAAPQENVFDFSDLADLSDELPDLEDDPPAAGDLHARLEGLFAARRFEELLSQAEAAQAATPATPADAALAADPRIGSLAEAARERLEAVPYVARFLTKAHQALTRGDTAEAGRMLDKARSLDATHPGIAAFETELAGTGPGLAPAPPATMPPIEPPTMLQTPAATAELPAALRPSVLAPDLLGGGSGDAESERRIAQLLAEGQAALDGGDPQAAIDSWSRIFLIDIDHQEAARRIELARKVKAENERQVEEIFHDGVASLETGDLGPARRAFARVVELQPSYLAAREYLEQIDAGTVPVPRPRPAGQGAATGSMPGMPGMPGTPGITAVPPAASYEPAAAAGDLLPDLEAGELKEEILVPPEPGEARARGAERRTATVAAVRERRFDRKFLYVGGAVLALVLAVAGYLLLHWDDFFPNSGTDELAAPVAAPGPIERATALQRGGKTASAVAQLKRLLPSDPNYARAQELIAEWERPAAGRPAAPPALAPEVEARRQQVLAAARRALEGGDHLLAVEGFEQAAALAKLEAPDADQLSRAKTRLEPLAQQIALYKDREWEYVVPALWRLREENPGNRDIDRLLVDSYYNMGVRDLQHFDPESALKQFEEALKLAPEDQGIRRQYVFAQTYRERPQDLLFRIYVKYLPFR